MQSKRGGQVEFIKVVGREGLGWGGRGGGSKGETSKRRNIERVFQEFRKGRNITFPYLYLSSHMLLLLLDTNGNGSDCTCACVICNIHHVLSTWMNLHRRVENTPYMDPWYSGKPEGLNIFYIIIKKSWKHKK